MERSELGELLGKLLDRLDEIHPDATVVDAVLVVEIASPEEEATVLIQATTKRPSLQYGLLEMGQDCVLHGDGEDPE